MSLGERLAIREIGAGELNQVAEVLGVNIGDLFSKELNGELSVELNPTGTNDTS